MNKQMNIVYTFNNDFCAQVATSICSICENHNSATKIIFHLFIDNVDKTSQDKFIKMVKDYKQSVVFYKIDDLNKYFNFEIDTHGWHPVVLARLLIDRILPKTIDRVLYLDGDTIVRDNLETLYYMDLKNKTLGMSIEPTIDLKRIKALNLGNYFYCNAGVMLMNLKKWRSIKAGEKILRFYAKNHKHLFANDQDVIACVMKNEIKIISPKYNFSNSYYQYPYHFFKNRLRPLKYIDKKIYFDAIRNPIIIHFLGEDRPWRAGNTHRYTEEYRKYLKLTCWKDTPEESGWQLYFFCWKIFNILIFPFPHLHLWLINRLIPVFMFYRSKKLRKNL